MRTVRPSGPLIAGAAAACALFGAWVVRPSQRATPGDEAPVTSASTALEPAIVRQVLRVERTPVLLEEPSVPASETEQLTPGDVPVAPVGAGADEVEAPVAGARSAAAVPPK